MIHKGQIFWVIETLLDPIRMFIHVPGIVVFGCLSSQKEKIEQTCPPKHHENMSNMLEYVER